MDKEVLIKDKEYGKTLTELGFCMIPLLSIEQLQKLNALYQEFAVNNDISGLVASHSRTSPAESLRISETIRTIITPSLSASFQDYDFFISGFMVKGGHTASELPLHQDWNIVDEKRYTSYQIWIPLELSYPANGGMFVLPGSHRFLQNLRSGSYGMPMIQADKILRPLVVDMIIPPGNVLVYHNSLFHASYPNDSPDNRISVIVGIFQKNAPLEYYDKNVADGQTDVYAIDPAIFLTSLSCLEKGEKPILPKGKSEMALNDIDNSKIISSDLYKKYIEYFGREGRELEAIQLHILKDKELEKKMYRDGYVVVDFLDEETVASLKAEYIKLFNLSHTSIGRFTPMEHSTPEAKRHIHNLIIDKAKSKLDHYFANYKTPIASFFTKYANSEGNLTLHNDTSLLLNTHLEPHYGIWCPLIDVNEQNGALCVIERSHKFSHVMFLNGLEWPYISYLPEFNKKKKILHLKAGQMVLFDLRLIHDATSNKTDEDRICFAIRLTHEKSQYYSFIREKEDESVSIYKEDFNYYLKDEWSDSNESRNKNSKIGEVNQAYSKIDYTAIETALSAS
jgi:ectoine hydroxylase-related dioxygenase (phytanoyl-CoA dioxygenase family)